MQKHSGSALEMHLGAVHCARPDRGEVMPGFAIPQRLSNLERVSRITAAPYTEALDFATES